MTQIIKKVDRTVPPNQRSQVFTEADGVADDILMIDLSLGHPGSHLLVEADDYLAFRFNSIQKVAPRVEQWEDDLGTWAPGRRNLTREITITGVWGMPTLELQPNTSLELDNDLSIKDIYLVTVSGTYTITVM